MKHLVQVVKHYILFHTAVPHDPPSGPYHPEARGVIGAIVRLKDDPKKQEYEVVCSGPISRGPMRQFPPSISFLCRKIKFGYENSDQKHYDYLYFRKDSLIFIR